MKSRALNVKSHYIFKLISYIMLCFQSLFNCAQPTQQNSNWMEWRDKIHENGLRNRNTTSIILVENAKGR